MASDQVLDAAVRRHVFTSERPFLVVLDGIFGGISQPDIGALVARLAACASYEEFTALVGQAQGSAGLMRFLLLDLDTVLALGPQAHQAGRRLVRLIAGNPVTLCLSMGRMTFLSHSFQNGGELVHSGGWLECGQDSPWCLG